MKIKKETYLKPILMVALLITVVVFFGGCGEKTYHVGILSGLDFFSGAVDGFKMKMTELGYTEGKNIVYDVQKSNIDIDFYKNTLKKFVNDKVDLIFSFPTESTQEAKAAVAGTNIPVVFTIVATEDTGIVKSIDNPGDNITGVRLPAPELALERFKIMRELMPKLKRIYVPYMRGYPIVSSQLKILVPAAESAGVQMVEIPANTAAEVEAWLKQAQPSKDGSDAILMLVEPLTLIPDVFTVLGKFAAENKMPIGGAMMEAGGYQSMFGLLTNINMSGKDAAVIADQIFKGKSAGTIPVVTPENNLIINYKEIEKLGLQVNEELLSRANQVIR